MKFLQIMLYATKHSHELSTNQGKIKSNQNKVSVPPKLREGLFITIESQTSWRRSNQRLSHPSKSSHQTNFLSNLSLSWKFALLCGIIITIIIIIIIIIIITIIIIIWKWPPLAPWHWQLIFCSRMWTVWLNDCHVTRIVGFTENLHGWERNQIQIVQNAYLNMCTIVCECWYGYVPLLGCWYELLVVNVDADINTGLILISLDGHGWIYGSRWMDLSQS